jgi:site-specific DNA-methyltransferase (adenine-specific)
MCMVKLYHGDYKKVVPSEIKANLIFTSPPYNIGSSSPAKITYRKTGGYDSKSYRSIREYSDNLPEDVYQESQIAFLRWAHDHLADGAVVVYNHKPRRKNGRIIHPLEWISKVSELSLVEEVVWDRKSTHNHCNKMLWQHTERLYVLRRTTDVKYCFLNHKGLSYRSDVWSIPRAKVNGHNAPFPLELAEAVIEAWSVPGDCVMDPYMGSGTVGCACKRMNRNFIGSEKLKKYYNMASNNISEVHNV